MQPHQNTKCHRLEWRPPHTWAPLRGHESAGSCAKAYCPALASPSPPHRSSARVNGGKAGGSLHAAPRRRPQAPAARPAHGPLAQQKGRWQHHTRQGDHPRRTKTDAALAGERFAVLQAQGGEVAPWIERSAATGTRTPSTQRRPQAACRPPRSLAARAGSRPFFKCTSSSDTAAGVTPGTREACPSVCGRWVASFCRTSKDRAFTAW